MRILQLTPGTGSFYCGSCMRDNTLVGHLRRLGHDAQIAPLYLPFKLEADAEGAAEGDAAAVRMGGINVYLQQLAPWLARLPRFVSRALDSSALLRMVSARSNMTDPSGLGPLTLSVLRGEEGRQAAEVDKLVAWMGGIERPDVVLLSNAMLLGLARRIRTELDVPVLCTLQGEAPFLDSLADEHRAACWETLGRRAADVDGFLAVSRYTAELMTERMGLDPARVHVVHNGIELEGFAPAVTPPERPTIGYLARLCVDKGLPDLVEAFLELKRRGSVPGLQLRAGGVCLPADEALVNSLEARLRAKGFDRDAELKRGLSVAEKHALLRGSSVLSVPAGYGESFGLYLLEAWATGVPVVQPRRHGFPELLEATGAGLLYEPTGTGLADALEELLLDPARAAELGARGREAVRTGFDAARMAGEVAEVCASVARMRAPAAEPSASAPAPAS